MKNKYVFLRHAETVKDPEVHPALWKLTPEGLNKIEEYNNQDLFAKVDVIVTSTENKAIATANSVKEKYDLPLISFKEFSEIGRSSKFLTDEEFLIQKKRQVTELDTEVDGGESGQNALNRIKRGIVKLENLFENKIILVVSHGTIMSLYFAELTNNQNDIFSRWQNLPFCAVGKIENGLVIKDLI